MENNKFQIYLDKIITGAIDFSLAIKSDKDNVLGVLYPITIKHLESDEVIQNITEWRNQNKSSFLTEFTATNERTKNWLQNIVYKTQGQLLFLLYEDKKLIGHLGFKNLNEKEALLDNAVKGCKTINASIMVDAHKVIAKWLFDEAKIDQLYGYVLTDNIPAIMMNRSIGFIGWDRYPLLKEENKGEINWKFGQLAQNSEYNKYCYKIVLNKECINP
jgi:RimJ/RimL family protein N-acetyltransferase